jgi:ribosome biogenesis GTPase / thiamine phosphate phosphatase
MSSFINTIDDPTATLQGIVYRKSTGSYYVFVQGHIIPCSISSRLRKQLIYPTADPNSLRHVVREVKELEHVDPVAVGDEVRFIDAQDGTGMIVEILPRHTRLTRRTAAPMPGAHTFEQVIVANVDQVIPVFAAANPAPKWRLLDRYLVSAESLQLPALICINKIDLAQDENGALETEIQAVVEMYQKIGYPVVLTSAVSGEGQTELLRNLSGHTSVFVGKSGVGKTSLLNALQPGLGQRVNEVSQVTGKGKHTTTHLEMFPLDVGGAIVDTPGVREFGPWDIDQDDLALYFPEMRPLVGQCKFGLDCRHDAEPGCVIRKAVMEGVIHPLRYQSFLLMKGDT